MITFDPSTVRMEVRETVNGLRPVVTDDWFTDWPIGYADGSVSYDYPESIPESVKAEVSEWFKNAREDGCND